MSHYPDKIDAVRVGLEDAVTDTRELYTIECNDCRGTGHPYCGTVYAGEGAVPCYDYDKTCSWCGGEGSRQACVSCDEWDDECVCGGSHD